MEVQLLFNTVPTLSEHIQEQISFFSCSDSF